MSDPDRLAEITEHLTDHQDIHEDDGWWLLGKVDRLRDLLARLEWAGIWPDKAHDINAPGHAYCPSCRYGPPEDGHAPGCELAAVLHPTNDEADVTPKDDAGS